MLNYLMEEKKKNKEIRALDELVWQVNVEEVFVKQFREEFVAKEEFKCFFF